MQPYELEEKIKKMLKILQEQRELSKAMKKIQNKYESELNKSKR